ncbi:MAG: methyltransferase domain-containing protein [Bryobacteraceae bacterium]
MTSATLPSPCTAHGWRSQFGCPRGWLGWLVGHLMAWKNRERSEWVIGLLGVMPGDRTLEIGFGSGADIRRVLGVSESVSAAGVDHSQEMVRQARRRNRQAVLDGRADLRQGPADRLPFDSEAFDKVFSINVAQFWTDPRAVLAEAKRVMRSGATIAVAVQPRHANATREDAIRTGESLHRALEVAGFTAVALQMYEAQPVPVACATAVK